MKAERRRRNNRLMWIRMCPKNNRQCVPSQQLDESADMNARRRSWATFIRTTDRSLDEDDIRELSFALAAHHHLGSARVPNWIQLAYQKLNQYVPWLESFLRISLISSNTPANTHGPMHGKTWNRILRRTKIARHPKTTRIPIPIQALINGTIMIFSINNLSLAVWSVSC